MDFTGTQLSLGSETPTLGAFQHSAWRVSRGSTLLQFRNTISHPLKSTNFSSASGVMVFGTQASSAAGLQSPAQSLAAPNAVQPQAHHPSLPPPPNRATVVCARKPPALGRARPRRQHTHLGRHLRHCQKRSRRHLAPALPRAPFLARRCRPRPSLCACSTPAPTFPVMRHSRRALEHIYFPLTSEAY